MYFIAIFAALMMVLSTIMVINPYYFSDGIISFSKKSYFHLFEICSRIIAGIIFAFYSKDTLYPPIFLFVGYMLILVGIGLSLTPPRFHKEFAVWSANRFRSLFRLIGIFSIPISLFLIYASFGNIKN